MARQLYEIGLLALQDSLEGSRVEHYREVGYVLKAAADRAATEREYTREDFRRKVAEFLLEFIVQEIKLEQLADAKAQAREREELLSGRAGDPLPSGFPTCLEQIMPEAPKEFSRDRPLVLVGQRAHLDLLADEVIRACRTRPVSGVHPQLAILHCVDRDLPTRVDRVHNQGYWQLGRSAWAGKGGSYKQLSRTLNRYARLMVDETFDLVLLDDVLRLQADSPPGASPVGRMLSLNKLLRKWAEDWHCGLVLLVPLEERSQIDSDDWQRLAPFATVLQVYAEPSPKTGGHRLSAGNLVLLDGISEKLL